MVVKKSNLCLSADVTSTRELLSLASRLGPSIVILKTHYDILTNWDNDPHSGTGTQLAALARKHGFLIFEDRKFGDIGSTVQKQYTAGPGRIVEWAHITNAHILPGEAIVTSLAAAAAEWREKRQYEVKTDISAGTPRPESMNSETAWEDGAVDFDETLRARHAERKGSIVSITTVSQHFEDAINSYRNDSDSSSAVFPDIAEPPLDRGLLLLAQMSSAGNLLDAKYAATCVEIARRNKGFVMGYIAQESLNSTDDDQFLSMTPGCQLPPPGEDDGEGKPMGDGMGQQYNTPLKLVKELGTDIIIVGRGIIKAADPVAEAERYRIRGWEAYEARIKA
jgi:uridine monophosphate synthetase